MGNLLFNNLLNSPIRNVQFGAAFLCILILLFGYRLRKARRISASFFVFWSLFWFFLGIVSLIPYVVVTPLLNILDLYVPFHALTLGSIFILFMLVFQVSKKPPNLNRKINAIIRNQAISEVTLPKKPEIIKMKVAIIIPAKNEDNTIGKILETIPELSNYHKRVFVVNDGSTDKTLEIARSLGAIVCTHSANIGVGGALKTGYILAQKWGADYILQLDADGQHDPEDIPRLIEHVEKGVDIVVGSRFIDQSPDLHIIRKIGIKFWTYVVNRLSKNNLTDITSGFRAFRTEILSDIWFDSETYWAVAMTLQAGRSGLKVTEIPIQYCPRIEGKSQFHNVVTFLDYNIKVIMQILDIYI